MDRSLDDEAHDRIRAIVLGHPTVLGVHDLRTRSAGARSFVELHLEMDGDQSLRQAHDAAVAVLREIEAAIPGSKVFVHTDPVTRPVWEVTFLTETRFSIRAARPPSPRRPRPAAGSRARERARRPPGAYAEPTRTTGASRDSKRCSDARRDLAADAAATLSSWTTMTRLVFLTDAGWRHVEGTSERRSRTSTSAP